MTVTDLGPCRLHKSSECDIDHPNSRGVGYCILVLLLCFAATPNLHAQALDVLSLERGAKLRETERYQLNIAEKYFKEKKWSVALSEYDKYITLYESSDAASYAMLKWSICQVNLRKANTAIKEGFQSVIDYWPDSPDAVSSSYLIAKAYKDIGQVDRAKKAYAKVLKDHKGKLVAVLSMVDLIDISTIEKDLDTRVALWKKLTFDTTRTKATSGACQNASHQLAAHYFGEAAFDEAVKALETSYNEEKLADNVITYSRSAISRLIGSSETAQKGETVVKRAIAYLREKMPSDLAEDAQKLRAKQNWFHIAELHALANHFDEVPKTYQQIEKIFGVDDEALGKLAAWYKTQKKLDLARATYRRYKNNIEGLNQVAYSYRPNDVANAVAVYNQLVGLDPDNTIRWKTQIAATYRAIGKYIEAIAVYEELVTLDIENSQSWRYQIGYMYHSAKQYKEAIAVYRQCTNFPTNYSQMADCHRRLKQYKEAIALYTQIAVGHEASAPSAMLEMARTREQAGQKEQAIKQYQLVCKKFPKDRHASIAHAYLQSAFGISITLGGSTDK